MHNSASNSWTNAIIVLLIGWGYFPLWVAFPWRNFTIINNLSIVFLVVSNFLKNPPKHIRNVCIYINKAVIVITKTSCISLSNFKRHGILKQLLFFQLTILMSLLVLLFLLFIRWNVYAKATNLTGLEWFALHTIEYHLET